MFQIVYHIIWILALVLLAPIYLYRLLVKGKYRSSTLARLGVQSIPDFSDKNVIWLHSVSLGESQIASQFAKDIRKQNPDAFIVASSCTETGQQVLIDSPDIDFSFYYPIDLWFHVRHIFKRLKPKAIFIMETDLWPNMMNLSVSCCVPVYVINAKISENSFSYYLKLPFLKNILLDTPEMFFVQCLTYKERFLKLDVQESRLQVSGNLKLDRSYPEKTNEQLEQFSQFCGLDKKRPTIVFASTHPGEEQPFVNIILALREKFPELQAVIVPRHPERFREVEKLLKETGIEFDCYSMQKQQSKTCSILLVDAMGVLMDVYAICDIAVVAGSFTEKVGGHNIFEPSYYSKPVVYGPWMFKQPGFNDLARERKAGIQITDHQWQEPLLECLEALLQDAELCEELGRAGKQIVDESQGIGDSIVAVLQEKQASLFNGSQVIRKGEG